MEFLHSEFSKTEPEGTEGVTVGRSVFSVTELTQRVKGLLEPTFQSVWIKGEVSNFRPANSGHLYFSLKDAQSMISVALFGWGSRKRPTFELKEGLEVLCRGRLSVYAPRGSYQLVIEEIEPVGAGAYQLAFEQLKAKLLREGLMDPARKKPLPRFPKKLVVITSATGAAIKDVLQVLGRRAPHLEIQVLPVLVQGPDAPPQIVEALRKANLQAFGDLILLTRGGGSVEDLWAFNDESLARAVAASAIPVLSAVGHEIDFTLCDFVADRRAPTPSAGAEILSADWVEVRQQLEFYQKQMGVLFQRLLSHKKNQLLQITGRLKNPADRLREQTQQCDELQLRMGHALQRRMQQGRMTLGQFASKLDALSPLKVLERGYCVVKDQDTGHWMGSAAGIVPGKRLNLVFHDGNCTVEALDSR